MTARERSTLMTSAGAALIAIFLLYLPGTQGALYYDDYNALNPLGGIKTAQDAIAFVLNGTAGPTGRPIALASYLPHAAGWPESSRQILLTNVVIHLANALLLGLIAAMLLRLRAMPPSRAGWIALGAATLWAAMPLIASATLIAIQRMTTLAAFFSLLGLAIFIAGYRMRDRRPWLAFGIQFGALGAGTLLGLHAKESAALTPVFALLIDTLLLGHKPFPGRIQALSRLFLFAPLVFILLYLSPPRLDWFAVYPSRGWTPWERLEYQIVLLWDYLRLALAPLPTLFGPFHDDRALGDFSGTQHLIAALAWAGVAALGLWIRARYRNPWPLFILLWFFAGHLLESTVLSLELMFEHRNYLAVFGLALGIALAAAHAPGRLKRLAPLFFGALLAINAAALFAMTTLWGDPMRAAQQWTERYPNSPRAAMHAAFIATGGSDARIADLNATLIQHQRERYAIRILDRAAHYCSRCADVRFQALLYACGDESETTIRERFETLRALLGGNGRINISVADGFFAFETVITNDACPPLGADDVLRLVDAVDQRRIPVSATWRSRMLFVGAKVQYEQQRLTDALDTLARAERAAPAALPVLQFQVFLHGKRNEPAAALAAIARRRPLERAGTVMTDAMLDTLEQTVRAGAMRNAAPGA